MTEFKKRRFKPRRSRPVEYAQSGVMWGSPEYQLQEAVRLAARTQVERMDNQLRAGTVEGQVEWTLKDSEDSVKWQRQRRTIRGMIRAWRSRKTT